LPLLLAEIEHGLVADTWLVFGWLSHAFCRLL
jgi:hypothetical protein